MDIGQFYAVTADNRDPYWLYGGLQDSGNWGGPSNSRDYNGILGDHWFKFHSGDGFHTTVDPEDWRIVYTETQNGSVRRLDATFRQVGDGVSPRPATIMNYEDVTAREGARAAVPLQLELAADPLAARFEDAVPRRQLPDAQHEPRRIVGDHQPGSVHEGSRSSPADRRRRWASAAARRTTPRSSPSSNPPLMRGLDLGRHRRWERAGDARRGQDVDERAPEHPAHAGAAGHVGQPRRAVALRCRHRVRVVRRSSPRRLQAVRAEDDRLRPDVDVDREQSAGEVAGLRREGRPEEPEPAVRRQRDWRVRVGRRRRDRGGG